jgi:hypothetical protein
LTAHLEKTILSEKIIEEDLSRVEESPTKCTYRLGVGFERCEKNGEKSAPKFVPSSSYHKEEEALKPTKSHYPSNPKPSFNPKRDVKRETPKPRDDALICMFRVWVIWMSFASGGRKLRGGVLSMLETHIMMSSLICRLVLILVFRLALTLMLHLTLFQVLCLALLLVICLSSLMDLTIAHMVLVHERTALSLRFGYGPRPHHGDCFLCRSGFLARGSFTHLEPRHLDGSRFPHRGSRPTQPSGEVQRTVKTFSSRMVKC